MYRSPFPLEMDAESVEDILELYDRYEERPDTSWVDLTTLEGTLAVVVGDEYAELARRAIIRLWDDGARPIGAGTTRVTFRYSSNLVAKVPIDGRGVMCSMREAEMSISSGKTGEIPIADCDLDEEDLILWMESVEPFIGDHKTLPDWAWMVDWFQVGHDRDGVLVAYDL
jgi:hypothetical protein